MGLLKYISPKKYLIKKHQKNHFSQCGEDVILEGIFAQQSHGFYVDVGAFHPFQYSNTALFYEMGWSGINIEPSYPGFESLCKHRKRDINLNIGIGEHPGNCTYYSFSEGAYNTFDSNVANELQEKKTAKLQSTHHIEVKRLSDVLNEHAKNVKIIDFMSIDVEGLDLQVLQSNDWRKFRPKVVAVEVAGLDNLENLSHVPVNQFMKGEGYHSFAKVGPTIFYKEK